VLSPAPRPYLLLGKNVAVLPVALGVFAIYLALAASFVGVALTDLVTALVAFAAVFLTMSTLGNAASILAPYRISPGSLKPTKTNNLTQLLVLGPISSFRW